MCIPIFFRENIKPLCRGVVLKIQRQLREPLDGTCGGRNEFYKCVIKILGKMKKCRLFIMMLAVVLCSSNWMYAQNESRKGDRKAPTTEEISEMQIKQKWKQISRWTVQSHIVLTICLILFSN